MRRLHSPVPLGDPVGVRRGRRLTYAGSGLVTRSRQHPMRSRSPFCPDQLFPASALPTRLKMVRTFPGRALEVLENNPEMVADAVGPTRAARLREGMERLRGRWGVLRFFAEHAIPHRLADPLSRLYGGDLLHQLEADPYRLLTFLPWSKVDRIARNLSVAKEDPRRMRASVYAVLQGRLIAGDTAIATDDLIARCRDLVGVEARLLHASAGDLRLTATDGLLQLPEICLQERTVARTIVTLTQPAPPLAGPNWTEGWIRRYEAHRGLRFSPEQRDALHVAVRSRLLVLGGPGTGKRRSWTL